MLWSIGPHCENYNVLTGFKNAVTEVKWSTCGRDYIYAASADKTVACFDGNSGERIARFASHGGIVNGCDVDGTSNMVASGSDDKTVRVHDIRVRNAATVIKCEWAVTSVAYSLDCNTLYTAGIDNVVTARDLRKVTSAGGDNPNKSTTLVLKGHTDTVTGLAVSPDGTKLLSNGMDNALFEWDISPFSPSDRCVKVLTGHTHNAEKRLLRASWSPDGEMVTCGTADGVVRIWDEPTGEVLYSLPGHRGGVQDVRFHPAMPVVASGGSDGTVVVGEL